jgi:hypothetical protein
MGEGARPRAESGRRNCYVHRGRVDTKWRGATSPIYIYIVSPPAHQLAGTRRPPRRVRRRHHTAASVPGRAATRRSRRDLCIPPKPSSATTSHLCDRDPPSTSQRPRRHVPR